MTPRDIWRKKEKSLNIKWTILLVLTQFFWVISLLDGGSNQEKDLGEVIIEPGHQVITLPALNFTEPPLKGQKKEVSLHQESGEKVIKAFLRNTSEDLMGLTGEKVTLEVPAHELINIKKYSGNWMVYPPIAELGLASEQGDYYEIHL